MSEEAAVLDTPQVVEEPSHLDGIFGGAMPEAPSEEAAEEVVDTEDTSAEAEAPAEEPQQVDELSQLQEQIEQLKKQNENAQSLINRQGNELGELRKVQTEKAEEKTDPNEYLNKFADDPEGAQRELIERELAKRDNQAREASVRRAEARNQVLALDSGFEDKLQDIRDWYQGKGANSEFVQSLSLDQLYGNVDLSVALGEIVSLQKQLAETQSKNDKVIDKLNKGSSVVNGRTGQPANSASAFDGPSTVRDIASLSDAELEKELKRLSKSA